MNTSGELVTLDVATGNRISSFFAEDPQLAQGSMGFRLSPDGSKLAMSVSTPSGVGVSVWEPKAGKRLYTLPPGAGALYWLAWSPDSRRLAIARESGSVAIWDLQKVEQILAQLELNP
jgi:WD40 repeat protein